MTDEQIVSRCQNCGGTLREHHKRGKKCPTRLKVTYWLPWTVAGYHEAVKRGREAAAASGGKVSQ